MIYDLILRNGTIYTSRTTFQGDIAIANGKIAEIGSLGSAEAQEVLDLAGLSVLPGIIDTQVHFREPGLEHKENIQTGTQAAVAGGVTTVLEMPNTSPPTISAEALADKVARASGRAWSNIGFFVGATGENADRLSSFEELPGTPGIKVFMGSSTGSLLVPDDEALGRVLRSGRKRIAVHAEDHYELEKGKARMGDHPTVFDHPFIRSPEAALRATQRIVALSESFRRPVHVLHISTLEEAGFLLRAKSNGAPVTAEVTPQHLYFAAPQCYEELGTLAQMNPPLRSAEHREALRKALREGVFDVFGSDHAPHTREEKAQSYPKSPSGMPGVQTLLPVLLTLALEERLFSIHDIVRMASENPARLYSINGKGSLAKGADADISIVDLEKKWTLEKSWIKSRCGWSPFEGRVLTGLPVHTLVNGKFALKDGEISQKPPGTIPEFGNQA